LSEYVDDLVKEARQIKHDLETCIRCGGH